MDPTSQAAAPARLDFSNIATREILRTLAGMIRAQANETEAEYAERFTATATAFAAFQPRDLLEEMLAAQIVGAHHAILDSLAEAMRSDDPRQAERLRRAAAVMSELMPRTMHILAQLRQRSAEALAPPPPVITPEPPPRRHPPAPQPPRYSPHREKPQPDWRTMDPAKMSDEQLRIAIQEAEAEEAALAG